MTVLRPPLAIPLGFLVLAPAWAGPVEAVDEFKLPKLPVWSRSIELRSGFGYKDNVAASSTAAKGSAFASTGFEGMLFRMPVDAWEFNSFVSASDARYFATDSGVESEDSVMASVGIGRDLGKGWKAGSTLQYVFLNQVVNVSPTSLLQTNTQVLGHSISARPSVRRQIGPAWVQAEFGVGRQLFRKPLDNAWQYGPQLTTGLSYGHGSEVSLSYSHQQVDYDTSPTAEPNGTPIAGTVARLAVNTVELSSVHRWDTRQRWRSTTRLSFEWEDDNGPGYYDYQLYRATEELRFQTGPWELSLEGGLNYYDFLHRLIPAEQTRQHQATIDIRVRAERKLSKAWKVFASFDHERLFSNLAANRYTVNTTSGGVSFTF